MSDWTFPPGWVPPAEFEFPPEWQFPHTEFNFPPGWVFEPGWTPTSGTQLPTPTSESKHDMMQEVLMATSIDPNETGEDPVPDPVIHRCMLLNQ